MANPVRTQLNTTATGGGLEALLTLLNIVLLAGLLVIFVQQYRRTKSAFSLGLVLFAGVFLLKELLQVVQAYRRAIGIATISPLAQIAIALGEAVALGILLYNVAK